MGSGFPLMCRAILLGRIADGREMILESGAVKRLVAPQQNFRGAALRVWGEARLS